MPACCDFSISSLACMKTKSTISSRNSRGRTEEHTLAAWLWPPGMIPASVCSESNLCSLLGGDGDANAESAPLSAAPLLLAFRPSAILEAYWVGPAMPACRRYFSRNGVV